MPLLPERFRSVPLAHRALHDIKDGRPENSRAAIKAAVDLGYGIEIDVQLTADNGAVVFHDYDLPRLTRAKGAVRDYSRADLASVALKGGDETIPGLAEVLGLIDGKVPLLIEIKDQDGKLGANVGPLEAAVAADIDGYSGELAVMSFNPHSVRAMQTLAPDVPRGLTTENFHRLSWSAPMARLAELTAIQDYEAVGACFISHSHKDLANPRVGELKTQGATILCWTVRSPAEERKARQVVHNVTFEGYLPDKAA